MKRELFTKICDELKSSGQKLGYVKFIKESTQCGLKRAKCDIADVCFNDELIDPYDILTVEEKMFVTKFKRRKGTYSEQERTSTDHSW